MKGPKTSAPAVEFIHLGMKFGDFSALDDVSLRLDPYQFHVLLGENGAGKSTLVKCLIAYQKPTTGQIVVDGVEANFASPRDAHAAGLGMVYQHFTLADKLSVAEHFILSRDRVPAAFRLKKERPELQAFLASMPFTLNPDALVADLSAGEKQKLEILMQLYQKRKILILDEPSSVLTPLEADEVLGLLKEKVRARELTVILITHKFRELAAWGDTVAILRRGKLVGSGRAKDFSLDELARLMIGDDAVAAEEAPRERVAADSPELLEVEGLSLTGPRGAKVLDDCRFKVRAGEIYGIAGVSGNGQKELVEVLTGLHPELSAHVKALGKRFEPTEAGFRNAGINLIPELPMKNACIPAMSVWENLAFRSLDTPRAAQKKHATAMISRYGIKTRSADSRVSTLSGGNVQRVVLARELRDDTKILVAANPCFGLDFKATEAVHAALVEARNRGAAVLLVSEDLDEVLALSDTVGVMFEGAINYEASRGEWETGVIAAYMAGRVPQGARA